MAKAKKEVVAVAPEKLVVAGHEVISSKEKVVMGKTYTEVLLADGSTQLI